VICNDPVACLASLRELKDHAMWRFALKFADAAKCSREHRLRAGVTEDFDFSSAVRAFNSGEVVFAVGDQSRLNVGEALHFIRKLCDAAPSRLRRLWLG
jgi:hypothetical protein